MPTPALRTTEGVTRKKSASPATRVKKSSSVSRPLVRGRRIAEATEIAPPKKRALKTTPTVKRSARARKLPIESADTPAERPHVSVRVAAPDTLALPAIPVGDHHAFSILATPSLSRRTEHKTSRTHHRVSFTAGLLIGSLIVGVMAVAYIALVTPFSRKPIDITSDTVPTSPVNTPTVPAGSAPVLARGAQGYVMGTTDARVSLDYFIAPTDVLAADNLAVIDKIVGEYGDIVQVRLRPMMMRASDANTELVRALACASDMSKAWDMYRDMVAAQSVGSVDVRAIAQKLDVPAGVFQECLDADVHKNDIIDTYLQAKRLGVQQPPTLAIGNTLFAGALSFRAIEEKILAQTL